MYNPADVRDEVQRKSTVWVIDCGCWIPVDLASVRLSYEYRIYCASCWLHLTSDTRQGEIWSDALLRLLLYSPPVLGTMLLVRMEFFFSMCL